MGDQSKAEKLSEIHLLGILSDELLFSSIRTFVLWVKISGFKSKWWFKGDMPETVFDKAKSAENWRTRVFLGVNHEDQLCLSWSHQKRMFLKIAVSYIQQTCRDQLRRRIFQTTMLPSAHAPSRLWERSWPWRVSHPGAMRAPQAHKQYRTPVQAAEFSYSVRRS